MGQTINSKKAVLRRDSVLLAKKGHNLERDIWCMLSMPKFAKSYSSLSRNNNHH